MNEEIYFFCEQKDDRIAAKIFTYLECSLATQHRARSEWYPIRDLRRER